jgi:hypothetical protein
MKSEFASGFRTQVNTRSVFDITMMIKNGRLDRFPYFGQAFTWTAAKMSRFIESMLLGLPVSEIWVEEDRYGALILIDGAERINAIMLFLEGRLYLKNLSLLSVLNNLNFHDLEYSYSNVFESSLLTVNIVSVDVHPILKCEFYRRLHENSGYKDGAQISRNYAFRSAFNDLEVVQSSLENIVFSNTKGARSGKGKLKSDARIQEFFLYLILIIRLKDDDFSDKVFCYKKEMMYGGGYHRYELNPSDTIESALDQVMLDIDFRKNTTELEENVIDALGLLNGRVLGLSFSSKNLSVLDVEHESDLQVHMTMDQYLSQCLFSVFNLKFKNEDVKAFKFSRRNIELKRVFGYMEKYAK